MRTASAPKRFKKVYVEISNICNLQCDFCPEVERSKTVMSQELFETVIGKVAPFTETVCFHLMGEPLSHPRFAEFLEVCAKAALPVEITTNGTLLDAARSGALLHPIIRQVNFSLHSFAANFPAADIGAYLDKVFHFTRRALTERPALYLNYRLWNLQSAHADMATNRKILEAVEKEFDQGLSDDARIDVRRKKNRLIRGRLYLHFDTRFDWPSLMAPARGETGFCHGLSTHVGIHADGTVVPCCLDKEAGIPLGNCKSTSLDDILKSERATRIVEGFRKRRLVEELCQKCSFISRFESKGAGL